MSFFPFFVRVIEGLLPSSVAYLLLLYRFGVESEVFFVFLTSAINGRFCRVWPVVGVVSLENVKPAFRELIRLCF